LAWPEVPAQELRESAVLAPACPSLPFESLYAEHHGWLHGWLRKKLGNAGDAADLAHDTYLRILATGRAPIEIRKTDALMYLALAAGMSPDDALRAHRLMVARENIDTPAQRQLGVAC
jgi:hypothetical protein